MTGSESSATSSLGLARGILEAEGLSPGDPESVAQSCDAVLRALYERLRPRVGTGGYETLIGRAAVMTAREYPRVGNLPIPRAGPPSSEELAVALENVDGLVAAEIAQTLLAEVLAFLGRLLGWPLTVVLLRDLWPDVASRHDAEELGGSSPPRPSRNEG